MKRAALAQEKTFARVVRCASSLLFLTTRKAANATRDRRLIIHRTYILTDLLSIGRIDRLSLALPEMSASPVPHANHHAPNKIMSASSITVRIDAIREEAPGIRTFVISRLDGEHFAAYEPGAHIDVTSPSGVTRQYSLCGDPERAECYEFAVKREPQSRGGSRSLHDDVRPGAQLTIGAPRNLFRLDETATEHILMAAGIGITPLISMAYRLLRENARFTLHYFVRDTASAAFIALLSEARFAEHVVLHCGVEPADMNREVSACLKKVSPGAHVYTCGPGPFMDHVVQAGESILPRWRGPSRTLLRRTDRPATSERFLRYRNCQHGTKSARGEGPVDRGRTGIDRHCDRYLVWRGHLRYLHDRRARRASQNIATSA